MIPFDLHSLSILTRWIHVAAMALQLGGGLLLWRLADGLNGRDQIESSLQPAAEKYEGLFWLSLGLLALTGVGNLGVFGAGLPALSTDWGTRLAIKLVVVLGFAVLSLLRTSLILGLRTGLDRSSPAAVSSLYRVLYGGTVLLTLTILFLAVLLAHG